MVSSVFYCYAYTTIFYGFSFWSYRGVVLFVILIINVITVIIIIIIIIMITISIIIMFP